MKKNKSIIIILFIILSFILIIFLTKNKPAISYNKSMLIDNKERFERKKFKPVSFTRFNERMGVLSSSKGSLWC